MRHRDNTNSSPPRDEDAGGDAPTNTVGNLQTYFDAAMARFLQERQVQQGYQDERAAAEVQKAQVVAAQEHRRPERKCRDDKL